MKFMIAAGRVAGEKRMFSPRSVVLAKACCLPTKAPRRWDARGSGFLTLAFLAICCGFVFAGIAGEPTAKPPRPLFPFEAKQYLGTNAVVVGKVAEVLKTEGAWHISLGSTNPRPDLVAVIHQRNFKDFTNLVEKITGNSVRITGRVSGSPEQPEIVLNEASQLQVLSSLGRPRPPTGLRIVQ